MSSIIEKNSSVQSPNNVSSENKNGLEDFIIKGENAPLRKGQPQFGKIFLEILEKYNDLPVLIDADTEKELTYRELKEKSIRLALWLRKQGIGKGDALSLITDIRLDASLFFLAALYEGIIFSPWLLAHTLETGRHKLKITRPKVVFSLLEGLDLIKEACKLENQNPIIVALDNSPGILSLNEILDSVPQSEIETYEPVMIDDLERDVSMIFFTSGSTGMPKGVAHSYLSILNNFIKKFPSTYPNQKGRPTSIIYVPPTFTCWYIFFITIMYEGGVQILHREFDSVETSRIVSKYKVNFYPVVTYEIAQHVRSGVLNGSNLSSVEEFVTGSSVINPIIFDTFKRSVKGHATVRNAYGMSENTCGVLTLLDYKTRSNTTADPIGFVEPNVQMKIVDLETGRALGPYKKGEICIKSPYMFLGYYNDPEETKKAIDEEGWYHSGDFGYYDDKKEIFFIERLKDLIKYRDAYITGSAIEQVLLKHPDVLEACVVAVPDICDEERPMAFVVKRQGSEVKEDDLIKMSSTIGDYNTLRGGIVFLEAFPRLANGKVAKMKLKQMAKAYERENV